MRVFRKQFGHSTGSGTPLRSFWSQGSRLSASCFKAEHHGVVKRLVGKQLANLK
jgi:hypothetical protein